MEQPFDHGSASGLVSSEEPPGQPPSSDDLPASVAAALHRGIDFTELVGRLLCLARARR